MSANSITRSVEIAAPVERVWQALTDHTQFSAWFCAAIDHPFVVGERSTGHMTYPGYEHFPWDAQIVAIEPMTRFALRWPSTGGDQTVDIDNMPEDEWTLVEFTLEARGDGTRLTVVESGFENVPESRRVTVMRDNTGGWAEQMENIRRHVDAHG